MPTFEVLSAKDAPERPRRPGASAQRQREYEAYVTGLGKGRVGRLQPGKDETPRAVAVRVSRAARRLGREVETWVVDGAVYFRAVG
jgi:hypothetical protein